MAAPSFSNKHCVLAAGGYGLGCHLSGIHPDSSGLELCVQVSDCLKPGHIIQSGLWLPSRVAGCSWLSWECLLHSLSHCAKPGLTIPPPTKTHRRERREALICTSLSRPYPPVSAHTSISGAVPQERIVGAGNWKSSSLRYIWMRSADCQGVSELTIHPCLWLKSSPSLSCLWVSTLR